MEQPPSEISDGFVIAAILQSDAAVRAIQRELKALYPGMVITSSMIRHVLHNAVLCQDLLADERIKSAQQQVAEVDALPADKRRARATGVFAAAASEGEETWRDTLWYDMTHAAGGG